MKTIGPKWLWLIPVIAYLTFSWYGWYSQMTPCTTNKDIQAQDTVMAVVWITSDLSYDREQAVDSVVPFINVPMVQVNAFIDSHKTMGYIAVDTLNTAFLQWGFADRRHTTPLRLWRIYQGKEHRIKTIGFLSYGYLRERNLVPPTQEECVRNLRKRFEVLTVEDMQEFERNYNFLGTTATISF